MRVLLVGLEDPRLRRGGLNRYLDQLASALAGDGVDVERAWIGTEMDADTTAIAPGLSWPRRLNAFASAIRRSRADVVDVHFPAHAYWAVLSGALRRRRLVVHFQGPWSLESLASGDTSRSAWVKGVMEGYVLRRADQVVTLSSAFRDLAIRRYKVAPHRVRVIAPGVTRPDSLDRTAARAQQSVGEGTTLVLAVRRLVERMGLDGAIRAFCADRRPNERMVIVGEGPQRDDLERLVRSLGADGEVALVGGVEEAVLSRWYEAADVSIVPSVAHEGYGLVVLESLAHGTPVLVSDVDGLRDAARECDAVFVADFAPGSLRSGLDRVLSDASLRVTARQCAARRGWTDVAREHLALYRDVVAGTLPRSVVVLDHTARCSGGELAITRLVAGYDPHRWRAHVVLAEHGPLESELATRGISYEVLELASSTRGLSREDVEGAPSGRAVAATLGYSWRLRRLLRRRRPDVVHTNSMKAHVYGVVASAFSRWALVMHVRDRWAPPYLSERTARRLRLLARFGPDALVANSQSTADALPVGAHVVASPLEPRFFAVDAPTYSPTLRLAIIGRLAPWKGQDLAIEAVAALPGEIDWHLDIAGEALFGEDDFARDLRALAGRLGVADRVRFLGHVEDVAQLLGGVDVAILSSRSPEPFGNVVAEAMAAGRVVVVPDRGGVTEFVTEGWSTGSGFFYAMGDATSLRDKLVEVAADPRRRVSVGENARLAAAAFRVQRLAPVMEQIYDVLT
jgi:glycosyltransferase involved in cell wall biosynthesis